MVEKMTAVWLIILTIMVCAAVPGVLIWLTATPKALAPFAPAAETPAYMILLLPLSPSYYYSSSFTTAASLG